MENIFEHQYKRKNGMIYLNMSQLMKNESSYNYLIKEHVTNVYFKSVQNTRMIICDEGCNAILQLENIFNIFVLKVLFNNKLFYTTQKLVDEIPFYIRDVCKNYNLNFQTINDMKIQLFIYSTDKLNMTERTKDCETDIFGSSLNNKMNEYLYNFEFDSTLDFKILNNNSNKGSLNSLFHFNSEFNPIKPLEIVPFQTNVVNPFQINTPQTNVVNPFIINPPQTNQANPLQINTPQTNQDNPFQINTNQANPFQINTPQTNVVNPFIINPPQTNQANPFQINPPQTNQANPFQINPPQTNQANPFQINTPQTNQANPFQINTNQANPFQINTPQTNQANPFQINTPQTNQANPFQINTPQTNQANPFQINTNQANPFQINTNQANPFQINNVTEVKTHTNNPLEIKANPFQVNNNIFDNKANLFQLNNPNVADVKIVRMDPNIKSTPSLEMYYKKINEAREYIQKQKVYSNSIIFFDIDLTLIDDKGLGIQPVIEFYNYVKSLGIKPVIITARRNYENNVKKTLLQLKNYNITDYYKIFFRNPETLDFAKYKLQCRKLFFDKGFKILMSVGDSSYDVGQYGGKDVLLQ